mgnify:CR=1 FL=1
MNSPCRRLADDFDFAFDDHVHAVRRLAAAHQELAGTELHRAAGERQQLELGRIQSPEEGDLAQHFRFLKDIHSRASAARAGRHFGNRIRHRPTGGKVGDARSRHAAVMLHRGNSGPQGGREVTTATDEFYRDIIEGLSIYSGQRVRSATCSPRSAGITRRTSAPPSARTRSRARCGSPRRCFEAAAARSYANVTILGGWFGVLAAVLLHDPRFSIGKVTSIDIDPRCAADSIGR